MVKYLSLFLFVFVSFGLAAQSSYQYSFDDCSYNDASGQLDAATSSFDPTCVCGVDENALYFDGNLNNLTFPDTIKSILQEDFTLSFYFMLEDKDDFINDIFSIRTACNFDSLFAIRYDADSGTIITDLGNSVSNNKLIIGKLNQDLCWHRYVITKNDRLYSVYLDNELVEAYLFPGAVIFGENASAGFGVSPCLVNSETRFRGTIDEFIIHTRALSRLELINDYYFPERIISRDTTIVSGSEVPIKTGATCTSNFSWNPTASLDDPSSLNPIASPTETTTYGITYISDNGCRTTDTMRIYVVEEDELDCKELLLPTAFTPNNDGLNDRYGISNLFLVDEVKSFQIFDRWGNKMWEGNDKTATWDGSFDGTKVNPGVYLYKISYTCSGEEHFAINNFTIIR